MTVIRFSTGDLFLLSPIRLSSELRRELDALGTCRWVVAPNRYHHLFMGEYGASYPGACLIAAPRLPEKRRDLDFGRVLGDAPDPEWGHEIEHVPIGGSLTMSEVAFYHRASRSLMLADFAINAVPASVRGLRLWARLNGIYGRLAPARVVRLTYRDKSATRASVEAIRRWDFRRIIPCHGEIVEADARQAFESAVGWLY